MSILRRGLAEKAAVRVVPQLGLGRSNDPIVGAVPLLQSSAFPDLGAFMTLLVGAEQMLDANHGASAQRFRAVRVVGGRQAALAGDLAIDANCEQARLGAGRMHQRRNENDTEA